MNTRTQKGRCEACGKSPRVLTKIESGQSVCRSCLREINDGLTEKDFATEKQVAYLRSIGFQASGRLLRDEYRRLAGLYALRFDFPNLPDSTSAEEVERLEILMRLRRRGVRADWSASIETLRVAEERASEVRRLFTKIVGVSHKNRDGSDRQSAIARCRSMEALVLKHEADNPVDSNAVAIHRMSGEQLGYVSADLAEEIVSMSQGGRGHYPYVVAITGSGSRDSMRGVNIVIVIAEHGVSFQRVQEYVRENSQEWLDS